MQYAERKVPGGYTYDCEDIFGTVHLETPMQVDGETLDDVVLFLLKQKSTAETMTGEVRIPKKGVVQYRFVRKAQWEDDDEEKSCDTDTHTSIQKPERVSIRTRLYNRLSSSWLARFAGAFLEAWRKSYPQSEGRK